MKHKWRMRELIVPIATFAMMLSACGTDDNSVGNAPKAKIDCLPGTITGAGSTFVKTIVDQWAKDYQESCPDATVNYQAVGSGAGIEQFTSGTVDFGASDVVMKPDEEAAAEAKGGKVLHIPWVSGGIAVMFNLQDIDALNLSPNTLASIFSGKVTKWNSPAIARDNPGLDLPDQRIQVIHRSDGSGTTDVFTSYLKAAAPTIWKVGSGKDVSWPVGQGSKGSDGVTAAVKQIEGSISYSEPSFPKNNSLPVARIKNPAGKFVSPDADAVAAALADTEVPDDLKLKTNYLPGSPAAYPISTVSWVIVHQHSGDATEMKLLRSFIAYALSAGQESAAGLHYSPLPDSVVTRAKQVAATIGVTE